MEWAFQRRARGYFSAMPNAGYNWNLALTREEAKLVWEGSLVPMGKDADKAVNDDRSGYPWVTSRYRPTMPELAAAGLGVECLPVGSLMGQPLGTLPPHRIDHAYAPLPAASPLEQYSGLTELEKEWYGTVVVQSPPANSTSSSQSPKEDTKPPCNSGEGS